MPLLRHRGWCLALGLLLGMFPWLLAAMSCEQCGRDLPRNSRLFRLGGQVFCSQRCFEASLPKCAHCGQPCRGGFERNGQRYCSKECLATTFPQCQACGQPFPHGAMVTGGDGQERFFCEKCVVKPRCFCCAMPAAEGELADGRRLCRECAKTAVANHDAMCKVAEAVRRRMRTELGIGTDRPVRFELVDRPALVARGSGRNPERELGLYCHAETVERTTRRLSVGGLVISETVSEQTSDEQNTILLLTHLSLAKLREVVAHELAHEWMQERYPNLDDLTLKEGWAEYVAAQVNVRYGQEAMNRRMENNSDPVYGDGYRLVKQLAEQEGMDGLSRLFAEANQAGKGK